MTDVLFFDKPERSKIIELANKQESIIKDLELWRLTEELYRESYLKELSTTFSIFAETSYKTMCDGMSKIGVQTVQDLSRIGLVEYDRLHKLGVDVFKCVSVHKIRFA